MKRVLSATLALLLLVSLTACGTPPTNELQKPSSVTATTNEETQGQQKDPATQQVVIAETVLVDEEGIKITAKELVSDSLFGPEIKLLIENNSGKDLTFQARNTSINGYMVENMMSVDVVDGKKANDALTFSASDLTACGIETIADFEFSFHIFTTADWEDYLDTPQIQLKTSVADTYEYTFDDSGDVAYDANGIKVVIKGLSKDDNLLGPSIVVYIENTSAQDITVQTREVSINGFMIDPLFSCDVLKGKRAINTITFLSSDLEENNITDIESVDLSFHIFDMTSWDDIVDTETINIAF